MRPIPRLNPSNSNLFVVLLRERLGPRDTIDPVVRVLVAARRSLGIPTPGFLDVYRNVKPDFVEVAQRKFCCWESALCSTLGICERQLVVLFENPLVAAEEPFADGHFRLRLTLTCSQCIIMQRQSRIEVATKLAELIRRAHFDLRLGEAVVCGFFDVDTRTIEVKREIAVWDANLGQFPRKKHAVDLKASQFSDSNRSGTVTTHISTLRSILITRICSHMDVVQSRLVVLSVSMLSQEDHHSQTLWKD